MIGFDGCSTCPRPIDDSHDLDMNCIQKHIQYVPNHFIPWWVMSFGVSSLHDMLSFNLTFEKRGSLLKGTSCKVVSVCIA